MGAHEASEEVEGVVHCSHHEVQLGWWDEGEDGDGGVRRNQQAGQGHVVKFILSVLVAVVVAGVPVGGVVPEEGGEGPLLTRHLRLVPGASAVQAGKAQCFKTEHMPCQEPLKAEEEKNAFSKGTRE